jgi:hypothetical protein
MISLPGIYPKERKSGYNGNICTLVFISVLFTIAKLWEQPRYPTTDDLSKKMSYIYIYIYIYTYTLSFTQL